MDFETDPLDGNEIFNLFDVDLSMLSKNMQQKVVKLIKPFSEFLKTFDSHQVHNIHKSIHEKCLLHFGRHLT
jgi:hypothetical protein